MNLTPSDLARYLKQHSSLVYLITGDEILLAEESTSMIFTKARSEGYEEHVIIEGETSQASDIFLSHRQNFSLFSSKKIIEIRFHKKITTAFAGLLVEAFTHPDSNQIILLRMPKLSRAEMQHKWYKAVEQHGAIITIWPLKGDTFVRWIKARFELFNIKTSEDGYALIAANTEGNLLAASQTIEKLKLCNNSESFISYEGIQQALSDQAHYDVFELCDTMLGQNPTKCLKILATLKAQDNEPAVILWALMQDFRKFTALLNVPPNARAAIYQKQGIWSTRQVVFQKALSAFHLISDKPMLLDIILQKAQSADRIIKGVKSGNIWQTLEDFCLIISSPHLYKNFREIYD